MKTFSAALGAVLAAGLTSYLPTLAWSSQAWAESAETAAPPAPEAPLKLRLYQTRPELHIQEPAVGAPASPDPAPATPAAAPQKLTPDPYVRVEDRTRAGPPPAAPPEPTVFMPPAAAPAGVAPLSPGAGEAARTTLAPALAGRTAAELIGLDMLDQRGERIGEVKGVARDPDGGLYAVTSVGGLLGFGARQVVVPLAAMEYTGARLIATRDADPEPFDLERFAEVQGPEVLGATP